MTNTNLRRILAVVGLVPLIVLPGGAHLVALWAIEAPESVCGCCHAMERTIDEWRRSTHHGVTCSACHGSAQGVLAKETAILSLLGRCCVATATGTTRETRVPREVCLTCHSRFYQVKELVACKHMAHPHAECSGCHRGLVHRHYDRDALALAVRERGASLTVDAAFPQRVHESFSEKAHFQHGFMKTMAFCGRCHRMAPHPRSEGIARTQPRSRVCETCHIRY